MASRLYFSKATVRPFPPIALKYTNNATVKRICMENDVTWNWSFASITNYTYSRKVLLDIKILFTYSGPGIHFIHQYTTSCILVLLVQSVVQVADYVVIPTNATKHWHFPVPIFKSSSAQRCWVKKLASFFNTELVTGEPGVAWEWGEPCSHYSRWRANCSYPVNWNIVHVHSKTKTTYCVHVAVKIIVIHYYMYKA